MRKATQTDVTILIHALSGDVFMSCRLARHLSSAFVVTLLMPIRFSQINFTLHIVRGIWMPIDDVHFTTTVPGYAVERIG